MKKMICLVLIFTCLLGMTACSHQEESPEPTVTVYYKRAVPTFGEEDSIIAPTQLKTSGKDGDIAYLLRKYLATTPASDLISPFSQNMTLINFKLEGLTATVVLSNEFADLTGMELTIALTCLSRTVFSLADCEEVIISANTRRLDGQNYITLHRDSYLLTDDLEETEN